MSNNRTIISRILFSQIIIALLGLVIIVAISFPLYKNYRQRYKINQEISDIENEVKSYSAKNENLKKLIEYLKSNQYVEEQARLNMNLKKPGEEVVVIKNNSDGTNEQISSSTIFNIPGLEKPVKEKKINNFNLWGEYFFSRKNNAG